MPPPKVKRTRASLPKSRRGCLTCKRRRVKCDETKPHCTRCVNFGTVCEGYMSAQSLTQPPPMASRGRMLLPKENVVTSRAAMQLLPSVYKQPHLTAIFEDGPKGPRDSQYFQYFLEDATLELTGGFEEPFWNRIVLQICRTEPYVRRFALSVAGVIRAMRGRQFRDSDQLINSHYQYALQQYEKSLRMVQQHIKSNSTIEPRNLLAVGILIFCFENLQGNTKNTIRQLQTLILIVKEHLSVKTLDYSHLDSTGTHWNFEDDLVTAFARLDGQLLSRPDILDGTGASILGIQYAADYTEVRRMPQSFGDISTARRFLEHVQYHSRPETFSTVPEGEDVTSVTNESPELAPRGKIQQLREQLALWWIAFEPHYNHADTPSGDHHFVAAVTLRIKALSTSLILQRNLQIVKVKGSNTLGADEPSAVSDTENILLKWQSNVLLDTCRELLRLGRKLVSDKRFVKGFMLDIGIIPSLFLVPLCSLDRRLGGEAIALLREAAPRKEGIWDSLEVAKTAEAILAQIP